MTDLTDLTVSQAISGMKNKEFSATELTGAYIKNTASLFAVFFISALAEKGYRCLRYPFNNRPLCG